MSLLLFASIALWAGPSQVRTLDPVEVEFRIRDAAMGAPVVAQDLRDWRTRYQALEALGRRSPGKITEVEREFIQHAIPVKHPNVRASALAAQVQHGMPMAESTLALTADRMPAVRIQCARALGALGTEATWSALAELALDSDPEVANAGRAQFFSQGPAACTTQLTFLQEHWSSLDHAAFLHLLDVLDRSGGATRLVDEGSAWLRSSQGDLQESPDLRVKRALWFTLLGAPLDDQATRWLAQEWLTEFPGTDSASPSGHIETKRRRRFDRVQVSEPQRAQLVQLLLQSGVEHDSAARRGGSDWHAARSKADRSVAGAISVHFAWGGSEPLPVFPIANDWSAELEEEVWGAAFGWANDWGAAADRVLEAPTGAVRRAAWNTLAETWSRTGVVPGRPWLNAALADDSLAQNVYRELVHSTRPLEDLDLLHAWWASQDPGMQLDLLREHSPTRKYAPWRGDLLDLWVLETEVQRTVLQLMASFEGDEELADRFLGGLREELDHLERFPVPEKDVIRGAWREAESRARWQMEAWMKIQGPGHVVERTRLLLRVANLGKELGKALVTDLVSSEAGCAALEDAFTRPELSRRMRYEILLLHPGMQDARRIDELFLAYPTCDEELQLRILERAGRGQNALARALLLEVAADTEQGSTLRFQAVSALVELGSREGTISEELLLMLDGTEDFEFQQVLVRALGRLALDHRPLRFLERYDDEFERSMIGDELLAGMVRIELAACEFEGRAPQLSKEVLGCWRALPTQSSREELLARFDGTGLSARNFAYSGWLDAARMLNRAGLLESALGERWWTWDGRLLMRLGEIVADDTDPAKAEFVGELEQAALIALEGEGPSSDREGILLRLRGRLLAGDLGAQRWQTALARVRGILDDWRAHRVMDSSVERTFGPTDFALGVDPRSALLALEVECRIRLARAAGDSALIQELRPRMKALAAGPSRLARGRLRALELDLED